MLDSYHNSYLLVIKRGVLGNPHKSTILFVHRFESLQFWGFPSQPRLKSNYIIPLISQ